MLTFSVYCLQKVPAAKWLGINVALWGVAAAASAGAKNYATLLTARIFLGIFEATIGPSLMLISAQYYNKSEQAPRFTWWYNGLGVAQIIGGLVSYGFQHVHHGASVSGWRIMFIVIGCLTIVVGVLTLLFIPDTPMKAKWLSEQEKVALLQHVSVNQTGVWSTKFNFKHLLEAVLDIQLWLLVLITILVSSPSFPSDFPHQLTHPDLRLQWRRNHLFRHPHRRIRLLRPYFCPPEHALRHRQYLLYPPCRFRHP